MVHDHQVVDGAIGHEELPLTVVDDATRGDGREDEVGIILRPTLVVIAGYLQGKEADDEDGDDGEGEADDQPPSTEELVVDHRRASLRASPFSRAEEEEGHHRQHPREGIARGEADDDM